MMQKKTDFINDCVVWVPSDYDENKTYKGIFFAHGKGECGTDINLIGTKDIGGLAWRLDNDNLELPYIVIAPQSERTNSWHLDTAWKSMQAAMGLFGIEQWACATGLSLGGIMVGQIFMNKTQKIDDTERTAVLKAMFPAMIDSFYIVAGWLPYNMVPEDFEALRGKHTKWVHGGKDTGKTSVFIAKNIGREKALDKGLVDKDTFIESHIYADKGHNVWREAYSDAMFLAWLETKFPEDFGIVVEEPEVVEVNDALVFDTPFLKGAENEKEFVYELFPNPTNIKLHTCSNITFRPGEVLRLYSYGGHTKEGTGSTFSAHKCHNIHIDGSNVLDAKYGVVISGEKGTPNEMNSIPVGFGGDSTGYFKMNNTIIKDSHHAMMMIKNNHSEVPIDLVVLHDLLCVRGGGEGHYIGSSTSNHPIKKLLIYNSFFIDMAWDGAQCKDILEGLIENCIYLNSGTTNTKNQQNGFNLINCKNLTIRNTIMDFGSLWSVFVNSNKDGYSDGEIVFENCLIGRFTHGIYLNRAKITFIDCIFFDMKAEGTEESMFSRTFTEVNFIDCLTNKEVFNTHKGNPVLFAAEGLTVNRSLPTPDYAQVVIEEDANEVYEIGYYGELGMGVHKIGKFDPSKFKEFIEREVEEPNIIKDSTPIADLNVGEVKALFSEILNPK